jgi:hypothetical protein
VLWVVALGVMWCMGGVMWCTGGGVRCYVVYGWCYLVYGWWPWVVCGVMGSGVGCDRWPMGFMEI